MNKVFLSGYLTKDPIMRKTKNDKDVASFSIGVNDARQWEQSYFLNCVAFGPSATFAKNNLNKGDLVVIDGRITTGSYVNKDGNTVYTTDIVVDNIKSYGSRTKGSSSKAEADEYSNSSEEHEFKKTINLGEVFDNNSNTKEEDSNNDWDDEI